MTHTHIPTWMFIVAGLGVAVLAYFLLAAIVGGLLKLRAQQQGLDLAEYDPYTAEVGGQRYRISPYRHSVRPYSEVDDEIGGRRDYMDGLGD